MIVVCAWHGRPWCLSIMKINLERPLFGVSHTICDKCRKIMQEERDKENVKDCLICGRRHADKGEICEKCLDSIVCHGDD